MQMSVMICYLSSTPLIYFVIAFGHMITLSAPLICSCARCQEMRLFIFMRFHHLFDRRLRCAIYLLFSAASRAQQQYFSLAPLLSRVSHRAQQYATIIARRDSASQAFQFFTFLPRRPESLPLRDYQPLLVQRDDDIIFIRRFLPYIIFDVLPLYLLSGCQFMLNFIIPAALLFQILSVIYRLSSILLLLFTDIGLCATPDISLHATAPISIQLLSCYSISIDVEFRIPALADLISAQLIELREA